MSAQRPRLLYISYDGMLEPLGQSQVLPYLRGFAGRGAAVTLMSFEKVARPRSAEAVRTLRSSLASVGIDWFPLAYHQRPALPATLFDALHGVFVAFRLHWRRRFEIVHARSHVAAMIAWSLARLSRRTAFVFDLRGFLAEERVEGGRWREGSLPYRLVKRMERAFLSDADEVITLTERARELLASWPGAHPRAVTVVPTCVDLAKFRPASVADPGARSRPTLAYAGSLGSVYELDGMLRFFLHLRERIPGARLLMLTRFRDELDAALKRIPVPAEAISVDHVPPAQVAQRLDGCDAGLIFCKPGLGRLASCPTKVAEYLALGLPVVINEAVGDARTLIGENRVGVVIDRFEDAAYEDAAARLIQLWNDRELRVRCRRVAEQFLSLDMGVERYWNVYSRLVQRQGEGARD